MPTQYGVRDENIHPFGYIWNIDRNENANSSSKLVKDEERWSKKKNNSPIKFSNSNEVRKQNNEALEH